MDLLVRGVITGLGALALAACSHSDPFENPDRSTDGPFAPGSPLRLTYNTGPDLTPAFDAAGTGLLFAFQRPGTRDGDQCLGLLPPGGGTARAEWCPLSAGSRDSTDRWSEPLAVDATTLLYARASRPIGATADAWAFLGTAPLASPDAFSQRQRFPFTASSGRLHLQPAFPVSLGSGRVAYLAEELVSAVPNLTCNQCARLVTAGVEAAELDVAGTAAPTPIAGTVRATSLAAGPAPGELLFTLPADARVFLRRADGSVEVLHEFGATAREPSLAAGRLVAVVGGSVSLWFGGIPPVQDIQVDDGGPLVMVDLASGSETALTGPTARVRRPRLAPDGRFVVYQTAGQGPDLFRLETP